MTLRTSPSPRSAVAVAESLGEKREGDLRMLQAVRRPHEQNPRAEVVVPLVANVREFDTVEQAIIRVAHEVRSWVSKLPSAADPSANTPELL